MCLYLFQFILNKKKIKTSAVCYGAGGDVQVRQVAVILPRENKIIFPSRSRARPKIFKKKQISFWWGKRIDLHPKRKKKRKEAPRSRASIYKDLLARIIVASLPSPGYKSSADRWRQTVPDPGARLCATRETHRHTQKKVPFFPSSFLF